MNTSRDFILRLPFDKLRAGSEPVLSISVQIPRRNEQTLHPLKVIVVIYWKNVIYLDKSNHDYHVLGM
jgi:hypothetical protein